MSGWAHRPAPGSRRGPADRWLGQRAKEATLAAWCIGCALFVAAAVASAEQRCPGGGGETLPRQRGALEALEAQLALLAQRCGADPFFLAYRGAVLLALDRPSDAANLLELALLLRPDLAVASIDYARALTRLGDVASAAAIWQELLSRPDIPPQLRAEIEARLAAVGDPAAQAQAPSSWRVRSEATLRLGYDTNLNSATSARELTLTLPDGDVTLPVADAAQPKPGVAVWASGRVQANRTFDGGRTLEARAELRFRGAIDAPGLSFALGDLEASAYQGWRYGAFSVTAGASDLRLGGNDLFQSARLSLGHAWLGDRCAFRAAIDHELRRFPLTPVLDGRYAGLASGATCRLAAAAGVALLARAGRDDAVRARPGGDQVRAEARAELQAVFRSGRLQTFVLVQEDVDQGSYSPLLKDNARRRIARATFAIEWSQPLTGGWLGVLSGEVVRQTSNLPLFSVQGASAQIGVRYVW